MRREVSLTDDVGWDEKHLQHMLETAAFWENFPFDGTVLVRSELKPSEIQQRIDLLFLSHTGELIPCELKIRRDAQDAHGQLIRYIADLHYYPWTLERVREEHAKLLLTIESEVVRHSMDAALHNFLQEHSTIPREGPLPVRKGGAIMNVSFEPPIRTAVRYLNKESGFNIQLIEVRARVDDSWQPNAAERWMRVDFEGTDP